MSDTKDGGPAFPRGHDTGSDGMSLRDWFAGQALAGAPGTFRNPQDAARNAYAVADAMLQARKVQP